MSSSTEFPVDSPTAALSAAGVSIWNQLTSTVQDALGGVR